jgi:histone-lysine N-methyltransferase SETD2
MSDTDSDKKTSQLGPELRDMKLEEAPAPAGDGERSPRVKVEEDADRMPTPLAIPLKVKSRSASRSPVKQLPSQTPSPGNSDKEEVLGGDITLKMEPGKAPKLSRTASQKVVSRPPPLYLDLPDSTEEAKSTFAVLPECTYGNKYLGTTEHALECDCSEEWGKRFAIFATTTRWKLHV